MNRRFTLQTLPPALVKKWTACKFFLEFVSPWYLFTPQESGLNSQIPGIDKKAIFSCPEQLYKSSCRSVGPYTFVETFVK